MQYVKLYSNIIHSTVWREDNATRIVWITMLAMADYNGRVESSLPGLADAARVSIEECTVAIEKLSAPDPYSRSPENEGRRIAVIEGGWLILNHKKYRDKRSPRTDYIREYMRKYRIKNDVNHDVNNCKHQSTHTDTDTDTDIENIREREYNAHAHAREGQITQEHSGSQGGKGREGVSEAAESKNDLDPMPMYPLGENAALNASYASQNENSQPNSFVMKPSERIVSLQGQNTGPSPPPPSYTLEEVLDRATMAGLTDDEATDFFHHYNAQGWVRANGQAIKNLASAMARWKKRQHEFVTRDKKDVRKRISGTGKTAEDYAEAAARDGSEYIEF